MLMRDGAFSPRFVIIPPKRMFLPRICMHDAKRSFTIKSNSKKYLEAVSNVFHHGLTNPPAAQTLADLDAVVDLSLWTRSGIYDGETTSGYGGAYLRTRVALVKLNKALKYLPLSPQSQSLVL
jgi:hypothetical protein